MLLEIFVLIAVFVEFEFEKFTAIELLIEFVGLLTVVIFVVLLIIGLLTIHGQLYEQYNTVADILVNLNFCNK